MRVRFYRTAGGASPVQKYIDGLSLAEGAKITAALEDIYWKQSQKAPRNEIEIARRRMKEILATDPADII